MYYSFTSRVFPWNKFKYSISKVRITTDELRMRCRRMCEKKPSGRINVDTKIVEQYKEGGESREVLEMALLECLAKHGVDRSSYKRIKASHALLLIPQMFQWCFTLEWSTVDPCVPSTHIACAARQTLCKSAS